MRTLQQSTFSVVNFFIYFTIAGITSAAELVHPAVARGFLARWPTTSGCILDGVTLFTDNLLDHLAGRSIALVGLMGTGKTSVGRKLAARIGLPFRDSDAEIELAAGASVAQLFARHGEQRFREGERRAIRDLLADGPSVLATGGGAFVNAATRAAIRRDAVSVWLCCGLPTLLRRVSASGDRPLLHDGDPAVILQGLMAVRHPLYAEADLVVACGDEDLDATVSRVYAALQAWRPPRRLAVRAQSASYDVIIGRGLLAQAGSYIAPVLASRRCVVVTDDTVAGLHLPTLMESLAQTGIAAQAITVPAGESSKRLAVYERVVEGLLDARVDRHTAVVALGGGVVGDLAGFAAATTMRGLPFVQVPTTLLAQVDSSVGGKTGVNAAQGKNVIGAFHQPCLVLADTGVLGTLPDREMRAGYAELVKAGLIGDAAFFSHCERHGAAMIGGDPELLAEAVLHACAFKAAVVAGDEREEDSQDGRALLNLGHTFGHALEAIVGYGGALLHGEAVAVGLGMAFRLSARLGLCSEGDAKRVEDHLDHVGLPSGPGQLNRRLSASRMLDYMRHDKKNRDGRLRFVLVRGIGEAFTSDGLPEEVVLEYLRDQGCEA
jgi:shikimate kinase/3-dehydroquinate synthase